jgi:EmrB/QacA subfamily drug resistance transporter
MTDTTFEPEIQPSELSHRAILIVLIPLMLASFIATLDQTIVATAIPGIGRGLHDTANSSWIATAYLLTSAVSTLILGKLGDMYGRKKVFQFAIITFLAGSLLCGIANSLTLLIVFRAFQGIGGGGLSSLVQAITADLIPARVRSKYMAYVGIVVTLALIAGPILGGVFVDELSWRWIFFINLPIGITALVILAAKLHLPTKTAERSVDFAGGATSAVFIAAGLVVAGQGNAWGWVTGRTLVLLAVALVGLVVFLFIERRAAEPITPLGMFRSLVFSISSAQFFLSTLVLFAAMLYVPQLMIEVHHYSALEAGIFLIPLLAGLIAATGISGGAIAKTGHYKLWPIIGAILTGAGMLSISRLSATDPTWILGVLLFFVGAGIGFFVQVSVLAGQNAVDYSQLGVATGALNFFKTVGGAFGAAIFGAILVATNQHATGGVHDLMHGFQTVFLWTVPFMALALILAIVMPEKPLSDHMHDIAAGKLEVNEY